MRAKLPKGKGIWSAFWMLSGMRGQTGSWPTCGELGKTQQVHISLL